jgi:hypothetical protein
MGAGGDQKIRLLHAQPELTICGRGVELVVRIEKVLDLFPVVRWQADLRPKDRVMQVPWLGTKYRLVPSRAGFYASSPLARRIADLKSLPIADQSPRRPPPGYRGVSVCAELTRVAAPNPRMRPEKKPPDVERRPTTPPLRLRLRWSALATVGSSILTKVIECIPFGYRARCLPSARWITLRSRIYPRCRRASLTSRGLSPYPITSAPKRRSSRASISLTRTGMIDVDLGGKPAISR